MHCRNCGGRIVRIMGVWVHSMPTGWFYEVKCGEGMREAEPFNFNDYICGLE